MLASMITAFGWRSGWRRSRQQKPSLQRKRRPVEPIAFQPRARARQISGLNTMRRANLINAMSRMFERMPAPVLSVGHPSFCSTIANPHQRCALKLETFSVIKGASRKWPDQLEYQLVRMRTKHHFSNNAKADVFNYRERLKAQPTDPALQYGLALALSKTNEHDQALALMQGLKSKISVEFSTMLRWPSY